MSGSEYETYILRKDPRFAALTPIQPYGFDIEILESDRMVPGQTDAIIISDIIPSGPADGKLQIGDKLVMFQNKSCSGMTSESNSASQALSDTITSFMLNSRILLINMFCLRRDIKQISMSIERHIESYEGDIADGKRHGKGVLIWKTGYRYEGDFFENKRTGKGKYFDKYGNLRYEGGFVDGVWNGKGKLFDENCTLRYEGDFVDGDWTGKGKYFDKDGILNYDGDFVDGKRHGKGKNFDENGKLRYEGNFVDGKMHGKGKGFDKTNVSCCRPNFLFAFNL